MYSDFFVTDTPSTSGLLDGKIDVFDVISAITDLLGSFGQTFCIIALIIGVLGCFCGFKLTKLFIGMCGFAAGGLIGLILALKNESAGYLLLGLILAIILAIVSYKLYKFGVFIISFLNVGTFSFTLALILFKEFKFALIIACIVGIVIGVISVLFTKPTLIISTAVSFGNIAGIFLAVLLSNETMSKILPLIFMTIGLFIQIKTNEGLFEGVSQKAADRIKDEITKNS